MNGEHFCTIGLSLPRKRSYQSMSALARPELKGTVPFGLMYTLGSALKVKGALFSALDYSCLGKASQGY